MTIEEAREEILEKVREEAIKEAKRKFFVPLGILQIICFTAIISTPFIWIWVSWSLAWKIGISGLVLFVVIGVIYIAIKKVIEKEVDEEIAKLKEGRS